MLSSSCHPSPHFFTQASRTGYHDGDEDDEAGDDVEECGYLTGGGDDDDDNDDEDDDVGRARCPHAEMVNAAGSFLSQKWRLCSGRAQTTSRFKPSPQKKKKKLRGRSGKREMAARMTRNKDDPSVPSARHETREREARERPNF